MGSSQQIGKKLKAARLKMNFTQENVANKVGLHVNSYAKLERGEVGASIETLKKLAKVLGVKSSDILSF